ncbi:DNA (cytosine-5-)-methyltransferase [Endozoicomonas elysicola]|uniref:Cytosine-specific methyltransferase n=1 Tax=Endozoicomonas elysicola TaxID=305900 RepID=A0A081KE17_9GAMM|nr:DNA (cytosine-5-)-methyltransferase [Endozoicomonas elysicola]KEI72393.1 DNA methyltransferase [Endozoicomonas elysicola]
MNDFLTRAEEVLAPEAEKYVPEGSTVRAVVHQWLHALAYEKSLFSEGLVVRQHLIAKLLDNGLYVNDEALKSNLKRKLQLVPVSQPEFTFIDLFAGIGGFRLALQENGGVSVFSSEWDKSAQKTYFDNYGEHPFGDITALTNESISDEQLGVMIPDHDVLAAGFPCQPFSHAGVSARESIGKSHGFKCTTQGTLFFDVMRIASVKKPKVLFLENVRNIERHDKGNTFRVIRESVEELGYDFKYALIDSSPLVPQRRVRCYMVCFRKDLDVDFKFPSFTGAPRVLREILEYDAPDSYTISDKLWQGHINRTQRNLDRGTGFTAFTANLDKPSNTLVARYGKDGKECLIPQENKNPRLLTLRECARLQGFPEEFVMQQAKTPAYRQFGNSVAVPVVSAIAKEIVKDLL